MAIEKITDSSLKAEGVATAWVNFNGQGVVTIRDQFNVASITDNGTGNYTVNFTVSLDNINYSATFSANAATVIMLTNVSARTINSVTVSTAGWSGNAASSAFFVDSEYCGLTVLGGKD